MQGKSRTVVVGRCGECQGEVYRRYFGDSGDYVQACFCRVSPLIVEMSSLEAMDRAQRERPSYERWERGA